MHAKIIIDDGGDVKKLQILEVHTALFTRIFSFSLDFPQTEKKIKFRAEIFSNTPV